MKSRTQIMKQIDRNLTYQSIRFNNKQISDESIKSTMEEYFPRLFQNEKSKELSFFTKSLKDQQFYKKLRTLVNTHLSIQAHLDEIEHRIIDKCKIQDSNSHCLEELNNKKMTRAALAKRNQLTQEELKKDQIYVRLTPKSQGCLQWMLCNRKFPRIECKLSCNQHIQYLVNYLSNKWLPGKGHNRIVLYPDVGSFLKNTLSAKQRQKILKQPLNNYFMFTDVMVGCGIGQNGILNLHYDILEKKKDPIRQVGVEEGQGGGSGSEKLQGEKRQQGGNGFDSQNKKVINLEEVSDSNKKSSMAEKSQKYQSYHHNHQQQNNNSNVTYKPQHQHQQQMQKNLFSSNPSNKLQAIANNNHNNNHSNHFLSNQSNLLNPNRSIYHDDESIFKSIGFFAFGNQNNGNSLGFKKNDFNLLSINSNSLMDLDGYQQNLQHNHYRKAQNRDSESRDRRAEGTEVKPEQGTNRKDQQPKPNTEEEKQGQVAKLLSKGKKQHSYNFSPKQKTRQLLLSSPLKDQLKKQQKQTQKDTSLSKEPYIKQIKEQNEKQESLISNTNKIDSDYNHSKTQEKEQVKKHQEKLLDLRNAISFLQEAEGFKPAVEQPQEEMSQKSGFKEIKTVSIKKKTAN